MRLQVTNSTKSLNINILICNLSMIDKLIKILANTEGLQRCWVLDCTVLSVSDESAQVEVLNQSFPSIEVLLNPDFKIIPKVGALCRVLFQEKEEPCFLEIQEIEEIEIMGGKNNGLVKVKELTEKINTLEKDLNDLKQVFQSWSVVPSDGGLALKTASATWASKQIQETAQKEIENDLFRH